MRAAAEAANTGSSHDSGSDSQLGDEEERSSSPLLSPETIAANTPLILNPNGKFSAAYTNGISMDICALSKELIHETMI